MRRHHIHHHCRRPAPGGSGIEPRWTRAAKDAVGTEVYWPALDRPRLATAHEAGGMGTAVKIWYHDIAPGNVPGNDVRFTFRWEDTDEWDTTDYRVEIHQ